MLSIFDAASAAAVLAQPLNPALRSLIMDRMADAEALDLEDQTHILAIEPGDTEAAIRAEIGWSPLVHPIEGWRFGTADFMPYPVQPIDLRRRLARFAVVTRHEIE